MKQLLQKRKPALCLSSCSFAYLRFAELVRWRDFRFDCILGRSLLLPPLLFAPPSSVCFPPVEVEEEEEELPLLRDRLNAAKKEE